MKCHPFIYLCCLITGLTLTNVIYIARSNQRLSTKYKKNADAKRYLKQISVTLLDNDEHSILSRIRYPDRKSALLYGRSGSSFEWTVQGPGGSTSKNHHAHYTHTKLGTRLTLGIASVARAPGVDYLSQTLHLVLDSLSESEKSRIVVVVAMVDRAKHIRLERAKLLYRKFKLAVDSGLIQIVAPSQNIYPVNNYTAMHRTYGNSVERTEWQAKLALDFAFLFSYSRGLSDYFVNLEDDVLPSKHFVDSALAFVDEQNAIGDWSSLLLSRWLSIGRLYKDEDLGKLVDLILIAYTKQPVDFVMHHFDVLQMANNFREIRRHPPLFEHRGDKSTLPKGSVSNSEGPLNWTRKLNLKYDIIKAKNPKAELFTNISQWQNYSLASAYYPKTGFFWGRKFKPGDVIDVVLAQESFVEHVQVRTGFDLSEERSTQDRVLAGQLLFSPMSNEVVRNSTKQNQYDLPCKQFVPVSKFSLSGQLDYRTNETSDTSEKTKCLRIQVTSGQSNWVMVRLIHIEIK